MVWSTIYDAEDAERKSTYCSPERQLVAGNASKFLDHSSALDINSPPAFVRLTGIICSIGPSSSEVETLEHMMETGMNIARLNMCRFDRQRNEEIIQNIRTAAENYSKRLGVTFPIAIGVDIKGAEIRLGYIEGGPMARLELKKGDQLKLTTDKAYYEKGNASIMYVDYDNIHKVVEIGNRVYLDDGLIALICTNIQGSVLTCTIENDGTLGSCKGVNLPGIEVDLPAVTQKDVQDLHFAVEHGIDIVFASFTREAAAVTEIRDILGLEGKRIMIVAKIENQQGLQNLDSIIKVSDGIMIGRGDLGIEIPIEKLFLAQKSITAKCNVTGKPVICSSQMLESMVKQPRPTRAESLDVANAVLDGSDCIMLTAETAVGSFPRESVITLAKMCKEAESAIWYKQIFIELVGKAEPPLEPTHAVAIAAVEAAAKCLAAAIIIVTTSGKSASLVAKYRPNCPVLAVTRNEQTARQLNLYRGILPLHYAMERLESWPKDVEMRLSFGISFGKWRGFIRDGDPVVAIHGSVKGTGHTDNLRVLYVTKTKVIGEPCCEDE